MRKSKITPLLFLGAMLLIGGNVFTNAGGVTAALSGSPLSNGTCTNCHGGASVTAQTVSVTTNIPATGFEENTDYIITVKAQGNGATAVKGGFNTTIETQSMNVGNIGTLTGGGAQTTVNLATHKSSSNTFVNDSLVWKFTWNSGTAQNATIYTAVNFANGNAATTGDAIHTTTLALNKSTIGLEENTLADVGVYPNPASEYITVSALLKKENSLNIKLYDLQGREVAELLNNYYSQGIVEETINLPRLASGNYILSIANDTEIQTERIMIK